MTGVTPSRWHFGRCSCCSEEQKHVFLLSQFQKECEAEKGVPRCVVTGLTPEENSATLWLWHYCLVSSLSRPQTQTRGDKWAFQLQDGFRLPGKSPGSSREKLLPSSQEQKLLSFSRFNKQKSISIFQQEIFPIQRNTEVQTEHLKAMHHLAPSPLLGWDMPNCWCLLNFSMTSVSRDSLTQRAAHQQNYIGPKHKTLQGNWNQKYSSLNPPHWRTFSCVPAHARARALHGVGKHTPWQGPCFTRVSLLTVVCSALFPNIEHIAGPNNLTLSHH